eukprot:TRINITY_DN82013_c0_g1_i1.p1 TRINITY_DN82013_c0_g1~~TRINITY_DN82013_c0_g1_i1.p1  ORF type:complete len:153 (+),score=22.43 TRINITY_DN82013_c0_g1_i1:180-638(+)
MKKALLQHAKSIADRADRVGRPVSLFPEASDDASREFPMMFAGQNLDDRAKSEGGVPDAALININIDSDDPNLLVPLMQIREVSRPEYFPRELEYFNINTLQRNVAKDTFGSGAIGAGVGLSTFFHIREHSHRSLTGSHVHSEVAFWDDHEI